MAWLKGLAGKAEDFLNQIDQNAAAALTIGTVQKDKQENADSQLTEVKWDSEPSVSHVQSAQIGQSSAIYPTVPSRPSSVAPEANSNPPSPRKSTSTSTINSVRSSPNLTSFTPIKAKPNNDDDLMKFLNSPTPLQSAKESDRLVQSAAQSSNGESRKDQNRPSRKASPFQQDAINENYNTGSETSRSSSRRQSPDRELSEKLIVKQMLINKEAEEIKNENGLLKSELQSFNNEMALLLQRAKAAEKECVNLQQQLVKLQAAKTESCLNLKDKEDLAARIQIELNLAKQELSNALQISKSLETENSRLVKESRNVSGHQNEALLACQQQLTEKEEEFERARSAHRQELISIRGSMQAFQAEKEGLLGDIAECHRMIEACRLEGEEWRGKYEKAREETAEVRTEFDQYRTRAQRILHDKDKLITELRQDGADRSSPIDDVTALEIEQLRQERDLVREEAMQVSSRLQVSRAELTEAERKLETSKEQMTERLERLQKSLVEEKSLRQAAEEDCQTQTQGLRSVREELTRQRSLLASKVQEREAELTKLRGQLSQRPVAPAGDELESRIHALTQTLVAKQSALETAATERNAIRMQYEKLEIKHRDAMAHIYNHSGINVNDTDDAKARVPSFLEETPFDTGVARRVKRAYSSLDAVSIRTGVFLRRYPLARILMLCYMVLLHLWVMVVLFSYTPDSTPKKSQP